MYIYIHDSYLSSAFSANALRLELIEDFILRVGRTQKAFRSLFEAVRKELKCFAEFHSLERFS